MSAFPSAGAAARLVAVVAFAGLLTGCETVSDAVYSFNPFAEKDKILPGTRTAVFAEGGAAAVQPEGARAASVGPAHAFADWSQPGGNAANDPGNVAYDGSAARVWSTSLGGGGGGGIAGFGGGQNLRISARPVAAGGRLFVYSPGAVVTSLSLTGGGRGWTVTLRPEGERGIAAGGGVSFDQGRVYVGTAYGELTALDAGSGSKAWTKELEAPARGAPTAAGGKVFVVTQTNVVYAVNQADGAELWSYRGIPETAGLLANASPAVVGDTVVVPYTSGEVIAFNATTGEPKWADAVTRATRTMALSSINDLSASPVVSGGVVYASGVAGRTIAIDLSTGARKWEQDVGSAHTPIVSGNAVFLVDLDDRVVALDRNTGVPLWATQLPIVKTRKERTNWAGPVLAGGTLWVVSSDAKLASVDASSGQITSTRSIGEPSYISPIAAAGLMITVSGTGTISAYR